MEDEVEQSALIQFFLQDQDTLGPRDKGVDLC